MIEAAMRLLQRNGYAATSWRGVVEEAGTPWGSAHHYFPGGKEQLTAAAAMTHLIDSETKERSVGPYVSPGSQALEPPWASSTAPVTYDAVGPARNAIAAAISSG